MVMVFLTGGRRRASGLPVGLVALLICGGAPAAEQPDQTQAETVRRPLAPVVPAAEAASAGVTGYVLGAGDQISIHAVDADDISDKPIRVDSNGNVRLPMAGLVKVAGLTTEQLESEIARRLTPYIRDPQVSVTLVESQSNPISVLGEVKDPGVHQIQGPRTLAEALSLAGGLKEDAGYTVKITRNIKYGAIPLASAKTDESGQYSVAEVNMKELLDARDPKVNIQVYPHDVITVPRAEMVYVVGEVNKPGGFALNATASVSVLQALSLAGGLSHDAFPKAARILRPDKQTSARLEIPINLRGILAGKAEDLNMRPDDVLFIPNSAARNAALRGMEAAIQIGTGIAIWGR